MKNEAQNLDNKFSFFKSVSVNFQKNLLNLNLEVS